MSSISKRISQQKVSPNQNKPGMMLHEETTQISVWPFPSADEMLKYRSLWDDFSERILSYAEKEQSHRHNGENKALSFDEKLVNAESFGIKIWAISMLIIPIICIVAGSILAMFGQVYIAAALLWWSLVSFWKYWSKRSQ